MAIAIRCSHEFRTIQNSARAVRQMYKCIEYKEANYTNY